jgi:hypothetical protein
MLVGVLVLIAACTKDPELVDATQVIVTVRSDLRDQPSQVEATIYDVSERKQGGHWVFDVAAHPLPFSFTVIPTLRTTESFLVALTARDSEGAELLQTKAIVHFVMRAAIGVELWLSDGCLGKSCGDGEICARIGDGDPACGATPTLEGKAVIPGQELDAATITEMAPVLGGSEAGASSSDASASEPGNPDAGSVQEAGSDGALTADASPMMASTSACLGTPSQAVCTDRVLLDCNAAGEVAHQETCQSTRQCQLGLAKKVCAPCGPGSRRCTGARLERCSEDGLQWETLKTCDSEPLCNPIAGDCVAGACTATTRACMDNDLYGCSPDLTQLTMLKECGSGTCDQTNGECDVCTPNARTCSGNFVEACDSRGQNLTRTECSGTTPKCTGNGQCVQCTLATECPAPSNTCLSASCATASARCGSAPRAAHATCNGGVCNGAGTCVECVDGSDCKIANARVCSNNRCVACVQNTDCPGGYECTSSNTCQRVSLAGTAASAGCFTGTAASGGKCGGNYCGVTQTRLAAALSSSAVCNLPAASACSGALAMAATTCAGMYTADAVFDSAKYRMETTACLKAAPAGQGVSEACIGCFAEVEFCCARDTLGCALDCSSGASVQCDAAKQKAGCLTPLYPCAGLPSPF